MPRPLSPPRVQFGFRVGTGVMSCRNRYSRVAGRVRASQLTIIIEESVNCYAIAEGRPLREPSTLCCGIGIGWVLFIAGFFLAGIPWYVGALILVCGRLDYREKAGYVACMVATILAMLAILFGLTSDNDFW
ncbi:60S ribosomal protein L18a-like protein isoform X2 [Beta vulgaris subsp. vulgaris]|uniref:60S ribosomal protein L18a-like protein isoform X2 n=1 Tax=Beta vulgaris subsp. vulgaris TaxID=3555 RepID=UPI0020374AC4|nr:60S ribosomal protein L18a-like protein isoform X2 [Beta vulgaris subsp. vulgaris]